MLSKVFSAIGSLPMGLLYGLSDAVTFLAGRVVGYRRKVIRENLQTCFPEKSEKELRKIEKGFYRFIGDYFVETLRLGRMSAAEIRDRMRFENTDEVNEALLSGHNVSLLLGHTGNWEWLSSIPLHLPEGIHAGQIYHALENADADKAFYKIRTHFGASTIKMSETLPTVMKWRREGNPFIIGYIADQSPMYGDTHYFADFFGRETPSYTGHERLSRMLHAKVFFCEIRREKRGRYVCRYVKMTDDAAKLPQFELTRQYYELLEGNIRQSPHLWLWSHKRWKRTKQGFIDTYGPEDAAKRLSHL